MRRSALLVWLLAGAAVQGGFALGQQTQYSVTPDNQPKDTASAEVMNAYSSLNQRLADAAEEPVSSCIKSYAVYQACKGGAAAQTCGVEPSCTAVGALPAIDLSGIRITFMPDTEMAVLVPSMSA
jgi:hypothetical protein